MLIKKLKTHTTDKLHPSINIKHLFELFDACTIYFRDIFFCLRFLSKINFIFN